MPEEMPRGPFCGAPESGEGPGEAEESQESDYNDEENGNLEHKELSTSRGNCLEDDIVGDRVRIGRVRGVRGALRHGT